MPIDFNLLKQNLPNFSNESLIQTALQGKQQNLSALQMALQAQAQQGSLAQRAAEATRQQQTAQEAQQVDLTKNRLNLSLQEKLGLGAQGLQQRQLTEQQRQFDTNVELNKDKERKAELFAQAYANGNQQLMYALDPEKAQKIAQGDQQAINSMQEQQAKMQKGMLDREESIRKEYLGEVGDFKEIASGYASFIQNKKALANIPADGNKLPHQTALVYAVAKMMDPGGKVTDKDFDALLGSKTLPMLIKNSILRLKNNELLTADQQMRLQQLAEDQYKSQLPIYQNARDWYTQRAVNAGVRPGETIRDFTVQTPPTRLESLSQKRKQNLTRIQQLRQKQGQ